MYKNKSKKKIPTNSIGNKVWINFANFNIKRVANNSKIIKNRIKGKQ